jgi:hypothetical protein
LVSVAINNFEVPASKQRRQLSTQKKKAKKKKKKKKKTKKPGVTKRQLPIAILQPTNRPPGRAKTKKRGAHLLVLPECFIDNIKRAVYNKVT